MKKLLLAFSIFSSLTIAAQDNYQLRNAIDLFRSNIIADREMKNALTETDIDGSPYLNDEFITGEIFTTSKTQFSNIPLRYNIYNDEIEFKSPEGNISALGVPEIIDKLVFGDYTMIYAPYTYAKKMNRGFFIVIISGKASLYVRPNIDYIKPVPPAAYKDAKPAKFVKKVDTYYIRIGTDAAQLIENKKDLEKVFPDHKKEIAAFIKNNKINHRKEDKLKELVDYYNSL